jgi:hypothetical protein
MRGHLIGREGNGYRSEPAVWWNDGMDEYMVEMARRFAASYISVQMHSKRQSNCRLERFLRFSGCVQPRLPA